MPDVDYYELLGVRPDATPAEIKSAYRTLVRSMHPDAGGTAGMFRLLHLAYETLGDTTRRAEYDRQLAARIHSSPSTVTVTRAPHRPRRRRFGDDPDFLPSAPDLDVALIPWWDLVDHATRVDNAHPGSPGHAPGAVTICTVLLLTGAMVLPVRFPVPLLIGWLLLLVAAGGAAFLIVKRYLAAIRAVRAFHGEFGTRTVFGEPGTERDQIAEQLTADVLTRYLTRLPGARIFHGLAWPDSVFADIDHAVLCGRRLVLVESKLWLPGHYTVDDSGELLRNGRRFRGGGTRLTESIRAFQRLLPEVEVRGALVIYPSRAGEVTTEPADSTDSPPMTADQFVHEVGSWLAVEPTTVEHDAFRTVLAQVVS